ncbi:MAG: secretin N-terminal domain-containing protein [Planctomycetota bacterium]|jgi:type IV pilus assembly protein PilQ
MVDFKLKRRMTKFVMLFLFIVCAFAFGEDAQQTEVLTTLEHRMQTKVSVDFRSTPIEDVIRIMASQADIDIVKSPTVTGNVTATLTDVPLEEALNNILAAHGFGYIAGKNMIRIAPFTEITEKVERLISRIYRITYADVACVEKALDKFKSPQGTISANPGTSNIIVTDIESKVKAIDTFIKEIDRITPQILVEVRIYDITSRDKLDIGIQWDAGLNTTFDEFGGTNPTGKNTPFSTGWFRGQIDVLIRAEQENTDAKLLANPRILVLDNERALFNIVTEHPYVERTITGNTVTETVKFKNVGVNLEVTPHVTRDGMVKLHIKPEFNVFVERVTLAASNVPVVDTRKADTRALVKDGHTIVLGGLRKKDVSQQTNKIPLLGDLPLIGGLFRFEGEDTATTELLVFITPRIIEKPVLSEDEKRAYEATDFSGPEQSLTRAETEAEKE